MSTSGMTDSGSSHESGVKPHETSAPNKATHFTAAGTLIQSLICDNISCKFVVCEMARGLVPGDDNT